ncbi:LysR family transcriptional regulator [Mesosutterella sp. OilRF-GAM-744-9]|uniref:LysR family transcriptional regulator n=1 Tax=Mesosutterella porci TaxID=2915351 RepID=A0ABS9MML9_9BURK|nr:LysR family transcriptional regulator [Mesosutterella sp. oilRF-744-WT-GAM-9]MCG5029856.1 LysR family transcriptional regulator [Mesosutterella sp. oilRF-744-WT-GAM-9]
MRKPKIQQLESLVTVAKFGSINAAAKANNIPQPSLSRTIKELEETVELPLVIRGRQGITLTKAGRVFAEHVSSVLSEIDRAIEEAQALTGRSNTKLSIGLSPITGNSIFPNALERMMNSFLDLSVHVEDNPIGQNIQHLRSGYLDLAVGNADADASFSEFTSEHLFDCPFRFVCAKGHPLEHATRLEELSEARWWVTGELQICMRKNSRFAHFSVRQGLDTRSHLVGVPLFEKGFVSLLSSVQIRKYRDRLSIIPIDCGPIVGHYSLLYRRGVPLTRAAMRMAATLHQEADAYDWHTF